MKTDKPVLRLRSGRWVCRGKGHQGKGKTPASAFRTWQANRMYAASRARIAGRVSA
jgi:hypothetical protein